MFINFWYPVVLSSDLKDQPRRATILSLDFAVFRDSQGKANVVSNVCPHRGGSLSGGKIMGDHLQCPYHGWQFDGSGRCHKIPSLGANARIPARTRVDAYPVIEKYGVVFAFLGDLPEAERPPLLEVPEYGQAGWRATWMNFQLPYNYERSVENGIDPAHNEFVHPSHGFSGESAEYKVNDLRWVGDPEWGVGFFTQFRSPASNDGEFAKMKQATDSREAGTGAIGPNQIWTYIRFGAGKNMHQYMWEAPIDEHNTNVFFMNMRSTFLEEDKDQKVNEMNWMIAAQDIKVLSALQPALTPHTNTKEFMVPADEPILRYRKLLRAWEQRGWRINMDELNRVRSRAACAIPGPERRHHKGWVLDAVPTTGAPADVPPHLELAAEDK
ncbi:MAG: aromatic ring-hydroxylating dioxygenase subunit alpha [Gammaproteobacteria bacterium]